MATRKNGQTLASLNAQIAALQAEAEALRKREVADVVAKAKVAIAHYGLTAADLGFNKALVKSPTAPRSVELKRVKATRKGAAAKPAPRPVKFRDAQGNTWGGRGKRPDWFNAALAAGTKPEDLLAKN